MSDIRRVRTEEFKQDAARLAKERGSTGATARGVFPILRGLS